MYDVYPATAEESARISAAKQYARQYPNRCHPCPLCDKVLSSPQAVQSHIKTVHGRQHKVEADYWVEDSEFWYRFHPNMRRAKSTPFGTSDGPKPGALTGERETTTVQVSGVTMVIQDPNFASRPEAHECLPHWWTGVTKFRKKPSVSVDSTTLDSTTPAAQSSRPAEDNDQGLEGYPSLSKRAKLNLTEKGATARPFPTDSTDGSDQAGAKVRRLMNKIFLPDGPTTKVKEAYDDLGPERVEEFQKQLGNVFPKQPKRAIAKYQSMVRDGISKMKRKPTVQDKHMPKFIQRQRLRQSMK